MHMWDWCIHFGVKSPKILQFDKDPEKYSSTTKKAYQESECGIFFYMYFAMPAFDRLQNVHTTPFR